MTDTIGSIKHIKITSRPLGLLLVTAIILTMMSCIAAVPILIKHMKSKEGYVAKAEMPVPAEKVYSTAVSMAEERNLQVLKKEDDKFYLRVTDGVQIASLKAESSEGKTEITVTSDLPKEEEKEQEKAKEKELALRIINQLCTKLNEKCTVKEK